MDRVKKIEELVTQSNFTHIMLPRAEVKYLLEVIRDLEKILGNQYNHIIGVDKCAEMLKPANPAIEPAKGKTQET